MFVIVVIGHVSLFERLYTTSNTVAAMCRGMIDTQDRMHPALAHFSAEVLDGGRLQTGLRPESRPKAPSAFPWPSDDAARTVFIKCTARGDLGGQFKKDPGLTGNNIEGASVDGLQGCRPRGLGEPADADAAEGGRAATATTTATTTMAWWRTTVMGEVVQPLVMEDT